LVNDEPKNNNSQQGETVESITLAALLENPDPDFDVVVARRGNGHAGRLERATDDKRAAPPNPESKQA